MADVLNQMKKYSVIIWKMQIKEIEDIYPLLNGQNSSLTTKKAIEKGIFSYIARENGIWYNSYVGADSL